jgi:hypothetical protein
MVNIFDGEEYVDDQARILNSLRSSFSVLIKLRVPSSSLDDRLPNLKCI